MPRLFSSHLCDGKVHLLLEATIPFQHLRTLFIDCLTRDHVEGSSRLGLPIMPLGNCAQEGPLRNGAAMDQPAHLCHEARVPRPSVAHGSFRSSRSWAANRRSQEAA